MAPMWTLIIVTLMSCSDPLVKEYGQYTSKTDCETAMIQYKWDITPGQYFECRVPNAVQK